MIILSLHAAGFQTVLREVSRPLGGDLAGLRAEVAVAIVVHDDGVADAPLDLLIEATLGVFGNVHGARSAPLQRFETPDDIAGLTLQHEDDAAGQICVGAVHHEEVGKARDGDSEIGFSAVAPRLDSPAIRDMR